MSSADCPSAAEYISSWGLSRTEDIMNAARWSSLTPFSEKEAAMGRVPYMHNGEAMPSRLAGTTPSQPHLPRPTPAKAP